MKKNINKFCILCCFTLMLSSAKAQLSHGFITIGGPKYESGNSVIQTKDGGYAIAGNTSSYGDTAKGGIYVIKLDKGGNLQWTKAIGDTGTNTTGGIVQATDGGYVIAGSTTDYGAGGSDVYAIKLDASGNVKWTKTIGGPQNDGANSIVLANDGGFVLAGYTYSYGEGGSDMYVIKLDSAGHLRWTRTVGGTKYDVGSSIVQTKDHGYVIAGQTSSNLTTPTDIYLVKLDSAGNLKWTKTQGYRGGGANYNFGEAIINTADNALVVVGWGELQTHPFAYGTISKFDTSGAVLWSNELTYAGNSLEPYTVTQSKKDKGYIITGFLPLDDSLFVIKLDSGGNEVWGKVMDSIAATGNCIISTSDSGFAITGYTTSHSHGLQSAFLLKFDSAGGTCLPSNSQGNAGIWGLGTDTTGRALSGGSVTDSNVGLVSSGGFDSLVCYLRVTTEVDNIQNPPEAVFVFPNPSSGLFTISLRHAELVSSAAADQTITVFNVLGQPVFTEILRSAQNANLIDLSGQPNGIYLYRVIANTGNISGEGKLVIQK